MKIKIIIEDTPSWVAPETYVYAVPIVDGQMRPVLDEINSWLLRALNEMGVLRTTGT
jgi:hypothetical protein